ncbi:hypothetical protein L1987_05228 [Smallanthus sonchifolius]|uniref:Uncharacterized protein n=1 Tax=Smallanthus sonchifolius TaxID=185202 RepID=A0ACB9JUZ0_9ASTR|nr:hypothetical protein L1987_05228 [Smallanthus sonchifolius]
MVSTNPINYTITSPLLPSLSLTHTHQKHTELYLYTCSKAFEKIKQKLGFDGYEEDFDFNWLILSSVFFCDIELFKELV